MKKFILVLVAVIIAATEISSATEISCECNYKVKASDKDIQGRYENITDSFNEIILELPISVDTNYRELTITVSEDNSCYLVHVDEIIENSSIFIYTVDSVEYDRNYVNAPDIRYIYSKTKTSRVGLVDKVSVTSNTVQLPTLLKGKTYVVIYSSNDNDKIVRLHIRYIMKMKRRDKVESIVRDTLPSRIYLPF